MNTLPKRIVLTAGLLVDGTGKQPIEKPYLVIEGNKITEVGQGNIQINPQDGTKLDFGEATIFPGLIDTHTHLNYPGDGTHTDEVMDCDDDRLLIQSIANAQEYLRQGVTTIRDNGAKNRTTISLRNGIQQGLLEGPHLDLCVNPLTITGGHMWQMGAEADGVQEVIKGVRRLVKLEAGYIKVAATGGSTRTSHRNLPAYSYDELKALVDEAHKFNLLVAAHAHATEGIVNSLNAGVDMIIHCSWIEPDNTPKYRADIAKKIADAGTWVNPTLDQSIGRRREQLVDLKDSGEITEQQTAALAVLQTDYQRRLSEVNEMINAGVRMVTGSDCGWAYVPFNRIWGEMNLLVAAGLSSLEAIKSATFDAADSLAVAGKTGSLGKGKEADIGVFQGDPLKDVTQLKDPVAVFKSGRRFV